MSEDNGSERQAMVQEIERVVLGAVEKLDQRSREDKAREKESSAAKERLTNRVSIAAICLTMLMSFLNFARTERAASAASASAEAAKARSDAEANQAYYQTRMAARETLEVADMALAREVAVLPDGDPRLRVATVHHANNVNRLDAIDRSNRLVLFHVQDLERSQGAALRRAARIDRTTDRYDMGTRVLTLAVVMLSVSLLARRNYLFWAAIGVALAGAAIAVNGYFLLF